MSSSQWPPPPLPPPPFPPRPGGATGSNNGFICNAPVGNQQQPQPQQQQESGVYSSAQPSSSSIPSATSSSYGARVPAAQQPARPPSYDVNAPVRQAGLTTSQAQRAPAQFQPPQFHHPPIPSSFQQPLVPTTRPAHVPGQILLKRRVSAPSNGPVLPPPPPPPLSGPAVGQVMSHQRQQQPMLHPQQPPGFYPPQQHDRQLQQMYPGPGTRPSPPPTAQTTTTHTTFHQQLPPVPHHLSDASRPFQPIHETMSSRLPPASHPPQPPPPVQQQQQVQRRTNEPPPRIDPSQIPRIPCFTRPSLQPATVYNPDAILLDTPDKDSTGSRILKPPEALERYVISPSPSKNASPRNIRCATYAFPQSKAVADQCGIPLAMCVMPFAQPPTPTMDREQGNKVSALPVLEQGIPTHEEVPVVYYTSPSHEPIRCTSCQAYLNPFDVPLNHGSSSKGNKNAREESAGFSYKCIFCHSNNDASMLTSSGTRFSWMGGGGGGKSSTTTDDDVSHDQNQAQFVSAIQRCTSYGIVDHVVHGKYNVRPLRQPYYLYAIDVSSSNVRNWSTMAHAIQCRVVLRLQREYEVLIQQHMQQQPQGYTELRSDGRMRYGGEWFHPKIGLFLFDGQGCYFPYTLSKRREDAAVAEEEKWQQTDQQEKEEEDQEGEVQLAVMTDVSEDPFCPVPLDLFCYDVTCAASMRRLGRVLNAIPDLLPALLTTSAAASGHSGTRASAPSGRGGAGVPPDMQVAGGGDIRSSLSAGGAAMSVLHSALSETGGRGTLLTASRPTTGVGTLRPRGTTWKKGEECPTFKSLQGHPPDKHAHPVDKASAKFYSELGELCNKDSVRLDIVLLQNELLDSGGRVSQYDYYDIPTLGEVCTATCGKLRRVRLPPRADSDNDSLWQESAECPLASELSRLSTIIFTATDAVLKLRLSDGIRLKNHPYIGHAPGQVVDRGILNADSPELEMAHVGAESCIVMSLEHRVGGISKDVHRVYFQAALLYTTPLGQRRVRVMTLCVGTSIHPSHVFRNADYGTVAAVLSRQVVSDVWDEVNPDEGKDTISLARDHLVDTTVQILSCYRLNTTAIKSPIGQLILPETLQLLPIWSLSMLKSKALRHDMHLTSEERAYHMHTMQVACPALVTLLVHPNMYRVDNMIEGDGEMCYPKPTAGGGVLWGKDTAVMQQALCEPYLRLPQTVQPSIACLEEEGVYIIDDGLALYVYIGKSVSSEVLLELFSVQTVNEINANIATTHGMDCICSSTDLGKRTRNILYALRNWFRERPTSAPVIIVSPNGGTDMETLRYLLVDDPSPPEKSYVDYLCLLHKHIRQLVEKAPKR